MGVLILLLAIATVLTVAGILAGLTHDETADDA